MRSRDLRALRRIRRNDRERWLEQPPGCVYCLRLDVELDAEGSCAACHKARGCEGERA